MVLTRPTAAAKQLRVQSPESRVIKSRCHVYVSITIIEIGIGIEPAHPNSCPFRFRYRSRLVLIDYGTQILPVPRPNRGVY
jgi:hypothetical protein